MNFSGDPKMLEVPELGDICQRELQTRVEPAQERDQYMKSPKLEGEIPLTLFIELHDLEFVLLGFTLALVPYFLINPLSSLLEC